MHNIAGSLEGSLRVVVHQLAPQPLPNLACRYYCGVQSYWCQELTHLLYLFSLQEQPLLYTGQDGILSFIDL